MKLKVYILSGKKINTNKLHNDIAVSNTITNFQGISMVGDNLEVHGDSFINEISTDSIISSHEDLSLSEYKDNKIKEIDSKTQELISQGFPYNGSQFSLSSHAQLNWIGMKTADIQDLLTFPMGITTIDDEEYSLVSKTDLTTFYVTGLGYKKAILDSGRSLKVTVGAAVDKAGIDAVQDNR